jgi:hypothetical protein
MSSKISQAARTVHLASPRVAGAATVKLSERFARLRKSGVLGGGGGPSAKGPKPKFGVKSNDHVAKAGSERRRDAAEGRGKKSREQAAQKKRGGAGAPAGGAGKPSGEGGRKKNKKNLNGKPGAGGAGDKSAKKTKKGKKGGKKEGKKAEPVDLDLELDQYKYVAIAMLPCHNMPAVETTPCCAALPAAEVPIQSVCEWTQSWTNIMPQRQLQRVPHLLWPPVLHLLKVWQMTPSY